MSSPDGASLPSQVRRRDLSLDLVRVTCLLVVVAAHVCFVAIREAPDGGMQNWTPPQELPFFAPGTWFIQPMPLFFVVGGCVSCLAWRSAQRRGDSAWAFFRLRLIRFAQPAAALFAILGVVFGLCVLVGVPLDLANSASYGVGTPTWFMGAYLLCQAALPLMVRAHRARPLLTLVVLALGAVAVDVLRGLSGLDIVGLANYLFVWPFAQQLGIWLAEGRWSLAEGRITSRSVRPWLLVGWAVATAATGLVASLAPYGADLLQNQIPPTTPLVTMAVAHTCLYLAVRPLLQRLVQRRWVLAVLAVIGTRAMTIYLWHAVVVIAIAAGFFFVPGLPHAPSPAWWLTRVPVFLVVLAVVWAISLPLVRFERGPDPATLAEAETVRSRVIIAVAGLMAVVPPFLTTIPDGEGRLRGLDLWTLLAGAVLLVVAVALLRLGRRTARGSG